MLEQEPLVEEEPVALEAVLEEGEPMIAGPEPIPLPAPEPRAANQRPAENGVPVAANGPRFVPLAEPVSLLRHAVVGSLNISTEATEDGRIRLVAEYRTRVSERVRLICDQVLQRQIPHIPFDHLTALLPSCVCLLLRHSEDLERTGEWSMVHLDFLTRSSVIHERMLAPHVQLEPTQETIIEVACKTIRTVRVRETAVIRFHGRNDGLFRIRMGVVRREGNAWFDYRRVILGRAIASRIVHSMQYPKLEWGVSDADGEVVFVDHSDPPKVSISKYQRKRGIW